MPEMRPGAQITKKPHINTRASQPGFRNRASDRLVPEPKTPANQQGQHGNLSATQATDQWIRPWEKNIPLLMHWNPISPTPIHGNINNMINERTPVIGINNVSDTLCGKCMTKGARSPGGLKCAQNLKICYITMFICIKTKWHTVLSSRQSGTPCYHQDKVAHRAIIKTKWHTVLSSRQSGTPCYHQDKVAHRAIIKTKWHTVLSSRQSGTPCYHQDKVAHRAIIKTKWHTVLSSRQSGTPCYHQDKVAHRAIIKTKWHTVLYEGGGGGGGNTCSSVSTPFFLDHVEFWPPLGNCKWRDSTPIFIRISHFDLKLKICRVLTP